MEQPLLLESLWVLPLEVLPLLHQLGGELSSGTATASRFSLGTPSGSTAPTVQQYPLAREGSNWEVSYLVEQPLLLESL